jgi:Ras GTPase-activating-like protein IQGAP2/3
LSLCAAITNNGIRLPFNEVKAHAIYYLLELEKLGKITREDGYQGILNAIAGDVRSKHRKRIQRQQERDSMQQALRSLGDRKKNYEEQIKSYNDYVEGAMKTMQKSGKGYASLICRDWNMC